MSKKSEVSKNDNSKRIAFVISPIGEKDSPERKRADQILKHVIEPVVSEFGYRAVRADNIPKPGVITTQVINHIINDPLVIADLTGHNPNVFYELAVRHVIRMPVIQIISRGEKIPFDVSVQRTIQIDHTDLDSVDEAKKGLRKQIKAVEKDPTLVDSPVSTAINLELMKESSDPERKAIADFGSILQEIYTAVKDVQNEMGASERKTLGARTRISQESYPFIQSYARALREQSISPTHPNVIQRIERLEEAVSRNIERKRKRPRKG